MTAPIGLRAPQWVRARLQRVGAWVVLFVGTLGSCALAPVPLAAQAPRIGYEVNELPPPGYLAVTECRAHIPISKIDPTLDSLTHLELRLHEHLHRLQLAPACDSILAAWNSDGGAYAQSEADAQCFAMQGMGYAPGTIARSTEREAHLLASSTRVPTMTRDSILVLFRRACGLTP